MSLLLQVKETLTAYHEAVDDRTSPGRTTIRRHEAEMAEMLLTELLVTGQKVEATVTGLRVLMTDDLEHVSQVAGGELIGEITNVTVGDPSGHVNLNILGQTWGEDGAFSELWRVNLRDVVTLDWFVPDALDITDPEEGSMFFQVSNEIVDEHDRLQPFIKNLSGRAVPNSIAIAINRILTRMVASRKADIGILLNELILYYGDTAFGDVRIKGGTPESVMVSMLSAFFAEVFNTDEIRNLDARRVQHADDYNRSHGIQPAESKNVYMLGISA